MEVLYGTCSENCAGYCRKHACGLTVKQIRNRECLAKNCWHLQKNESHEWWEQRNRTKARRKIRKENIKKVLEGNR